MRWLAAWVLFWVGDGVFRLTNLPRCDGLYPVYSRIMALSFAIQGDGAGPWRATPPPFPPTEGSER